MCTYQSPDKPSCRTSRIDTEHLYRRCVEEISGGLEWFGAALRAHLPELHLSGAQVEGLFDHYELLVKWNQKLNLTSVREPAEIVLRHYCESLFFANQIPDTGEMQSVID